MKHLKQSVRASVSGPSHPETVDTPRSRIEARLSDVSEFVETRAMDPADGPEDFAQFEEELEKVVAKLKGEIIAKKMGASDVDADAIVIDGRVHRRVLRSQQTYQTTAGPVRVERWLYKDRKDPAAQAVAAMDLKLGIVEGYWTPRAAEQAAWVVTQLTPAKGEQLFKRVGDMAPSKSSLDRLPKALSDRWEGQRLEHEQFLREALVVPEEATCIAVSLDGVLAPMEGTDPVAKRAKTAAKGKIAKGPAGYKEVGCATLSFCDDKGDVISAIRMGRAPERNKRTLKDTLAADLRAVLAQRALPLVKIADNWTFLEKELPDGVEILDFFHATEHLHKAIAAAYGDGTRKTRHRFAELRDVLLEDDDGVDRVIGSLEYLRRKHPRRKTLATELAYFRKNRARMRYAAWRTQGLPIGSGLVEAACKTLVTQRLKLSGMRWSGRGAQAILTLRGWDQSERFELAWARLAATYHREVHVLANVVEITPDGSRPGRR
jgi:hypothetical protein